MRISNTLALNPLTNHNLIDRPRTDVLAPARVAAADTFVRPPTDLLNFSAYLQAQGNSNSCGTTAAAMLLSFWKGQPGAYTHQKIDHAIRAHFDVGATPQNIVDYFRSQGFRAEGYNNATLADLRKYVDLGVPVQVMIDTDTNPKNPGSHYVDVVGFKLDSGGRPFVQLANPGGWMEWMPVEDFQKQWANVHDRNIGLGANNLMIVAVPKDATQVRSADGKLRSARDIALPKGGNFGFRLGVLDALADFGNALGKLLDKLGL